MSHWFLHGCQIFKNDLFQSKYDDIFQDKRKYKIVQKMALSFIFFSFSFSSSIFLLKHFNQLNNKIKNSLSDYPYFAKIKHSVRGYPRVIYDGYSYGLSKASDINREKITWTCTGSEFGTRKRCFATVATKNIDGYAMLGVRNQKHICFKHPDNPSAWHKPYTLKMSKFWQITLI